MQLDIQKIAQQLITEIQAQISKHEEEKKTLTIAAEGVNLLYVRIAEEIKKLNETTEQQDEQDNKDAEQEIAD